MKRLRRIVRLLAVATAVMAMPILAGTSCGDGLAEVSEPLISVFPTQLAFEGVPLGERTSQRLEIENVGRGTLVIDGLQIVDESGALSFQPVFGGRIELEPEQTHQLEVFYEPQEAVQTSGTLVITHNDRSVNGRTEIPISTPPPQPFIVVDPDPIDFGRVPAETSNAIGVTIENRGTGPLIISNLEIIPQNSDFSAPDLADLSFPVTLAVPAADQLEAGGVSAGFVDHALFFDVFYEPPTPGPDEGAILITYNNGATEQVELLGEAATSACEVSPNPIDFGFSPLGVTSSETVTLTNVGQLPLEVKRIYLEPGTSDTFELVGLHPALTTEDQSISLAGDSSLPFVVDYTPLEERADGGRVIIVHEEGTCPVVVSGVGVDNLCPVAVARGFIRDDPQQRRASQIDWATPTDVLVLDGSQSFDPDGQIVDYQWELTSAPEGTTTQLRPLEGFEEDASRRQFFIPLSGRYEFTLRVFDDVGFQDCDEPATVTVLSLPDEAIHIELSWHNPLDPDESDDQGSDVDLHLVKVGWNWFNDTFDTYYANQSPNWGPELPSLDIDDTDGAGPENIQMDNPLDCQWYAIGVHYFERQFGTAYATVRIYIDSEQIAELVNRPLERTDDFWDVGRLHWPSGQFFPVDEIYSNFDSSSATPPALDPEMIEAVEGGSCATPP